MGGFPVIRSTQTMMSWILLAAMLVSLPVGTTGHFVCTLGMAEAGPACPLCHAYASAEQAGPGVSNNCCKFVAGQSAPVSHLPVTQVEQPVFGDAPLLPADTGLLIAPEPDLTASACQRAIPRTPTSGYLSNFLRL